MQHDRPAGPVHAEAAAALRRWGRRVVALALVAVGVYLVARIEVTERHFTTPILRVPMAAPSAVVDTTVVLPRRGRYQFALDVGLDPDSAYLRLEVDVDGRSWPVDFTWAGPPPGKTITWSGSFFGNRLEARGGERVHLVAQPLPTLLALGHRQPHLELRRADWNTVYSFFGYEVLAAVLVTAGLMVLVWPGRSRAKLPAAVKSAVFVCGVLAVLFLLFGVVGLIITRGETSTAGWVQAAVCFVLWGLGWMAAVDLRGGLRRGVVLGAVPTVAVAALVLRIGVYQMLVIPVAAGALLALAWRSLPLPAAVAPGAERELQPSVRANAE